MRQFLIVTTVLVGLTCNNTYGQDDSKKNWMGWRGPNMNSIAVEQNPVTEWDSEKNVKWKAPVPGKGNSSPTIVGDRIFVTTSYDDGQRQTVLGYDRSTGKQLWETEINSGGFPRRIFKPNNTHASSTVGSDGKRLFAIFNNNDSVQLAALDMDGKVLWKKKAGTFIPKQYKFGFGSSPLVYDSMVIVCSECEQDGTIKAFSVEDGKEIWSTDRNIATSFSSPILADFGDKKMILIAGGKEVAAYDPKTGKQLWSCPTQWQVACGTVVWDSKKGIVFASGGFPAPQTIAVDAKTGKEIWSNRVKCYEQSMLYHDGHLYGIDDRGVTYCWNGTDGAEKWKTRLQGPVSSSPVLAGGNVYVANERGKHFIFKANPEKFELVAENKSGDVHFATPAFVDNNIYMRMGEGKTSDRKEFLVCIGADK